MQSPVDIIVADIWLRGLHFIRLLVHEAIVLDVLHVFVKLVYDWQGIGHFELFDILITYLLNVLEECPQSVFVRNNDHFLFVFHSGGDLVLPERNYSVQSVFQRLNSGKSIWRNILVFLVVAGVSAICQV